MKTNYSKLFLSLLLCLSVGFLGSIFTVSAIPTWYATLHKPFFSPPNWVFGPVWTTLYILMALAFYLIWQKGVKNQAAIFFFMIQLFLNFLWSILFFWLHSPLLGLIGIVFLWLMIFLTIKSFLKINKAAGLLLLPYLFWVSFASILNLAVYLLNR